MSEESTTGPATEALVVNVEATAPPEGVVVDESVTPPVGGAGLTAVAGRVLEGVGLGLGFAMELEQQLSMVVAEIPWGGFAAMRVNDIAIGAPHPHIPVGPLPPLGPVFRFLPLPQPGLVLDMGFLSGAETVFIGGRKAARCGDMGVCLNFCLGFLPFFEIFFGSATVWVEGARAARQLDPTDHCNLCDPPVGMLKFGLSVGPGEGTVLIGGVPLPSLLDFAFGKLAEAILGGVVRAARNALRRFRAARALRRLPLTSGLDGQIPGPSRNITPGTGQPTRRIEVGGCEFIIRGAEGYDLDEFEAFVRRNLDIINEAEPNFLPRLQATEGEIFIQPGNTHSAGGSPPGSNGGRHALDADWGQYIRQSGTPKFDWADAADATHAFGDVPIRVEVDANGRPLTAGPPADSVVTVDPHAEHPTLSPADTALRHELGHSLHQTSGTSMTNVVPIKKGPDGANLLEDGHVVPDIDWAKKWASLEEFATVGEENAYRQARNIGWLRPDYTTPLK